jgi:hypothetical protein
VVDEQGTGKTVHHLIDDAPLTAKLHEFRQKSHIDSGLNL